MSESHALRTLTRWLEARERLGTSNLRFEAQCRRLRWSNFRVSAVLDTATRKTSSLGLLFMRRRSRIADLFVADELLFALTQTGVCSVFSTTQLRRVCMLNLADGDVIRSMHYNARTGTVLLASATARTQYRSLHCRAVRVADIKQGRIRRAQALFAGEAICFPGFIEYNESNRVIVTCSPLPRLLFKVWDLDTFQLLHQIADEDVKEVRLGNGTLAVFHRARGATMKIRVLVARSGVELRSFLHLVARGAAPEVAELVGDAVVVKQRNHDLRVVNVATGAESTVPRSLFPRPDAHLVLNEQGLLAVVRGANLELWDSSMQLVASVKDFGPALVGPVSDPAPYMHTPPGSSVLVCYSGNNAAASAPTLELRNAASGEVLARIAGCDDAASETALASLTAVYYDPVSFRLFTGSANGSVFVWSAASGKREGVEQALRALLRDVEEGGVGAGAEGEAEAGAGAGAGAGADAEAEAEAEAEVEADPNAAVQSTRAEEACEGRSDALPSPGVPAPLTLPPSPAPASSSSLSSSSSSPSSSSTPLSVASSSSLSPSSPSWPRDDSAPASGRSSPSAASDVEAPWTPPHTEASGAAAAAQRAAT
jgi:hypothetical protein